MTFDPFHEVRSTTHEYIHVIILGFYPIWISKWLMTSKCEIENSFNSKISIKLKSNIVDDSFFRFFSFLSSVAFVLFISMNFDTKVMIYFVGLQCVMKLKVCDHIFLQFFWIYIVNLIKRNRFAYCFFDCPN
jgi:hypothetical protein